MTVDGDEEPLVQFNSKDPIVKLVVSKNKNCCSVVIVVVAVLFMCIHYTYIYDGFSE